MDSNPNVSMAQKYGIPQSDPGSSFAMNKYQGPGKVRPYSAVNRTTVGNKTAWDNQNAGAGGGSFQNFDDNSSGTTPPPSIG